MLGTASQAFAAESYTNHTAPTGCGAVPGAPVPGGPKGAVPGAMAGAMAGAIGPKGVPVDPFVDGYGPAIEYGAGGAACPG